MLALTFRLLVWVMRIQKVLKCLAAWQIFATSVSCCSAVTPVDLEESLDDVKQAAKTPLKVSHVDNLKSGPAKFKDYQCFCRLYTKKGDHWKEFGGAEYSYRYRDLFKAVIKSSDYRNGSVIVREPSGDLRGSGGGKLRFVKMNITPDSRTIKLPTGYSLASSDFVSLYEALKSSMSKGAAGFSSGSAVSLKLFSTPVTVLVLKEPGSDNLKEAIFVNPRNKTPILWTTFKNGQANAMISFENLKPNLGLEEELFKL